MPTLIAASGTRIDTPQDMLGVLTGISGDEAAWTAPMLGTDIGIVDTLDEQGFCRVVRNIWTRLAAITGSIGPGEDLATTSRWRREFVPRQSAALEYMMNQTLTDVQRCLRILEQGMWELDPERIRMSHLRAQDILDSARSRLSDSRSACEAFVRAHAQHEEAKNTERALRKGIDERDGRIETLEQARLDRRRESEVPSFGKLP